MRLKSRTKFLPHGFQLLLPEIGMKAPLSGSFTEMVDAFARIVEKNPALAEKQGWPRNRQDQEDWLDDREARRMAAHGWTNFIDMEDATSPTQKKTTMGWFRNAANAAGNIKTALAVYRDLLGPDGKVVAKEESERRAAICIACPKNDTAGGLTKYFLKEAAREIMLVAGMLKDMDVTTSQDKKLGVCEVCECPMVAKVHVVNEVLKKHITQDQLSKFPPNCWIPGAVA